MRFATIFVVASTLASSALGARIYGRQSEFDDGDATLSRRDEGYDGSVILNRRREPELPVRYTKREAFREVYGEPGRVTAARLEKEAAAEAARKDAEALQRYYAGKKAEQMQDPSSRAAAEAARKDAEARHRYNARKKAKQIQDRANAEHARKGLTRPVTPPAHPRPRPRRPRRA